MIVRHCSICGADVEMPVDTLAALAAAPGQVSEAVRTSKGGGEGWSAREVAAHLADTEVVTSWRLRQTLAQDEPVVQPYDQDAWSRVLRYKDRDVETALAMFAALRAANMELLRMLTDAEWERGFTQPEYGRRTLRDLIQHKSDHDAAHLRQIRGE